MAYNKDTDYQKQIDEAVARGDYASASKAEQARNEKIDAEGLSYEKTYNYAGRINGVDDATHNKLTNSAFNPSDAVAKADKNRQDASDYYTEKMSQDAISQKTKNAMNSKFIVPSSVTQADAYLASQLEKIKSGRTSHSDQVQAMMDKIMNREKFSYDVDKDPLFQQALASAMNSGKQAMQDTIGQASALTGGYGSTYATSAGNQAYNSFVEDAYDNIGEYYNMALNAWQAEGEEMYRQFGVVSELDDKEYNRNLTAYDATFQLRNQQYNEAYNAHRDRKSDAFSAANLELNAYGQELNATYNYYNMASNEADTLYAREYQSWSDEINNAWKYAVMVNSDWWNQANQDFQAKENQTQRDFQATESQKQRDFQAAESQKDRDFTASENAKSRAASRSGGGGGGGSSTKVKSATESQMKKALEAYNKEGMSGLNKYLNSIPDGYDKDSIAQYVGEYGELPLEQRTYTKIEDTINWFWGVDGNDKVKDQYGNEYKVEDLPKSLQDPLTDLKKGKSYTKK